MKLVLDAVKIGFVGAVAQSHGVLLRLSYFIFLLRLKLYSVAGTPGLHIVGCLHSIPQGRMFRFYTVRPIFHSSKLTNIQKIS